LKQLRSPFKFLGISDDHDPQEILNGLFGPLLVHGIPLQASSFRSEMASVFGKVIGRLTHSVARYGTGPASIPRVKYYPTTIAPDRSALSTYLRRKEERDIK
jgi:hypothetical protein